MAKVLMERVGGTHLLLVVVCPSGAPAGLHCPWLPTAPTAPATATVLREEGADMATMQAFGGYVHLVAAHGQFLYGYRLGPLPGAWQFMGQATLAHRVTAMGSTPRHALLGTEAGSLLRVHWGLGPVDNWGLHLEPVTNSSYPQAPSPPLLHP